MSKRDRSSLTCEIGRLDRQDDSILGTLLIALSCWRVALAIATGESFGAEATLALITTCLGAVLVFGTLARR